MERNIAISHLKKISDRLLASMSLDFSRYLYDEIEFDARLIILKGCRGVGKTTLLIQYLKTSTNRDTSIYLSLDNFVFAEERLFNVVDALYDGGYRTVVLDEVHKYNTWSVEVKNIYDSFPDLKLLLTASSALDIMTGSGDLSRRADVYTLYGLSFREFLDFEYGMKLPLLTIENLMSDHITIAEGWNTDGDLRRKFERYRKRGYYPFFKEAGKRYHDRVSSVVSQVIEVDLPPIFSIDYNTVRQVKKLLSIIGRIAPVTPNVTALAKDIGVGRDRILYFLDYLNAAGIIHLLKSNRRSDSALTKPDKIFLENTNIMYAIGLVAPNTGNERETYVMNALYPKCRVSTPAKGDFLVNEMYTFEVGGKNKTFHQISDMANAVLIKDGIDIGAKDIIPIWMLGLLY